MTKPIQSVLDTAQHYEALLLDLWGVVHDGQNLYPGVKETLQALHADGKKILFLSNAPRRAAKAAQVLQKFGIEDGWHDGVVTSGEAMFHWLSSAERDVGEEYFYIGPDKDLNVLDGLSFTRAEEVSSGQWLLNVGFFKDFQPLEEYHGLLQSASDAGVPMICANPDLEVVRQSGERLGCAGQIAHLYADRFGGEVRWFGKPHQAVYDFALKKLGQMPARKVLAVGDSLHTDILGASRQGIDSVLVTGGILHAELHREGEALADIRSEDMQRLIARDGGAAPTYLARAFGG